MARIDAADWVNQFQSWAVKMGAAAHEAMDRMAEAGGDVCARVMRDTSMWADDSGALRNSIKRTGVLHKDGVAYTEVYPHGKNREGERLETVGFVLEHGRTGRTIDKLTRDGRRIRYVVHPMPPRPWMAAARQQADGDINAAMEREWNKMKG